MSRLNALIEAAKAATPGPWIAGRIEATGTSENRDPYSPWFLGAGPRPISVGRGTCIHADDMAFIALANPAAILELCTLLQKAEEALTLVGDKIVLDYGSGHFAVQRLDKPAIDDALAAIKQWKEPT